MAASLSLATRRHCLILLKKSLDPVASTVEIRAEANRIAAIAFRRDVGLLALLHGKPSAQVGVVASVGKQRCPGFQTRQQFFVKSNVVYLAPAQRRPYRQTIAIDHRMNLTLLNRKSLVF